MLMYPMAEDNTGIQIQYTYSQDHKTYVCIENVNRAFCKGGWYGLKIATTNQPS